MFWFWKVMKYYSKNLKYYLDKWPGKRYFGMYRFLPIFFVLGAALEFSMINWRVGDTNFYDTYKRRQAKNYIEEQLLTSQNTSNNASQY